MDGRAGGTRLVHEVLADLKIRLAFFFLWYVLYFICSECCQIDENFVFRILRKWCLKNPYRWIQGESNQFTDTTRSPEMNSSECDFKGKAQIDSKVWRGGRPNRPLRDQSSGLALLLVFQTGRHSEEATRRPKVWLPSVRRLSRKDETQLYHKVDKTWEVLWQEQAQKWQRCQWGGLFGLCAALHASTQETVSPSTWKSL